jgi:immunity protein 10 of polymorphic toxin system
MVWFTAEAFAFYADESIDLHALVLAEFPDGSGSRFEIQRSVTVDAQDQALGMDTYCLVMDNGATHYGGVTSWRIDEADVLHISLDANAASVLETPAVEIALKAAAPEVVRHAMPVLMS